MQALKCRRPGTLMPQSAAGLLTSQLRDTTFSDGISSVPTLIHALSVLRE